MSSPVKRSLAALSFGASGHPAYDEMVQTAITSLKERKGSSKRAIIKYIMEHFRVQDEKKVNVFVTRTLKKLLANNQLLTNTSGSTSGSFRINAAAAKLVKKAKTNAANKAKSEASPTMEKKAAKTSPKKKAAGAAVKVKAPPKIASPKKAAKVKTSPVKKAPAAKKAAKK